MSLVAKIAAALHQLKGRLPEGVGAFVDRRINKPVQFLAACTACLGVLGGGWTLIDRWTQADDVAWLENNGYETEEQGYFQALDQRDAEAMRHLRKAGIKSPSPAALCAQADDIETLIFAFDQKLFSQRKTCRADIDVPVDQSAMRAICIPWNRGTYSYSGIEQTCTLSKTHVERITPLVAACKGRKCPALEEYRSEFERRTGVLRSLISVASIESIVEICVRETSHEDDVFEKFGGLIAIPVAPRRVFMGYEWNILEHLSDPEPCRGRKPQSGVREFDEAPDAFSPPDKPRDSIGCLVYPEERRLDYCRKAAAAVVQDYAVVGSMAAALGISFRKT